MLPSASARTAAAGAGTQTTEKVVLRREDQRLLRGQGQYVSDLAFPGLLTAGFVRSPHARARIRSVDLALARSCPGIALALAGADLAHLPQVQEVAREDDGVPGRPGPRPVFPSQWALAYEDVHFVGELIAVVVGQDRYAVEDALDAVSVVYEPLPAITDVHAALAPDAPLVHPSLSSNLLFSLQVAKGDVAAVLHTAPRTLRRRFRWGRNAGAALEGRAVLAAPQPATGGLTLYVSCGQPYWVRRAVAAWLGLPESLVRVVVPDVGGNFGNKGGVYPEDLLVAYLAQRLGRPVRWVEDRQESFLGTTQGRDQVMDATIAFDDAGRLLALQVDQWMDSGAYQPRGPVMTQHTSAHLVGPYQIPHFSFSGHAVATNKTPNAPYRGAGRPEATFVREALLDAVARELSLDPADLRRRNLVPPQAMPYDTGVPLRGAGRVVYDSGDYPELLRRVLQTADYDALRAEQARRRRTGVGGRLGIGLACVVEATGSPPFEGASIEIDAHGQLTVTTGACANGQGLETSVAQVVAELWGAPLESVHVRAGDTAAIPFGAGTYASRTMLLVSAAAHEATQRLQDKVRALAAASLEADPGDLVLDLAATRVSVRGSPSRFITLAHLARLAAPTQGLDPDAVGLKATAYAPLRQQEWSSAAHLAVVEVDAETAQVQAVRYAVCHDAGRIVNPLLAEGQVIGGLAQGLGGALLEEVVYDTAGQPLTTSLLDYLLPSATDMPPVQSGHLESPSPLHPLGIKGLGETGTIGAAAALANAVGDALADTGVTIDTLPVSTERLFRLLHGPARAHAEGGVPGGL